MRLALDIALGAILIFGWGALIRFLVIDTILAYRRRKREALKHMAPYRRARDRALGPVQGGKHP